MKQREIKHYDHLLMQFNITASLVEFADRHFLIINPPVLLQLSENKINPEKLIVQLLWTIDGWFSALQEMEGSLPFRKK